MGSFIDELFFIPPAPLGLTGARAQVPVGCKEICAVLERSIQMRLPGSGLYVHLTHVLLLPILYPGQHKLPQTREALTKRSTLPSQASRVKKTAKESWPIEDPAMGEGIRFSM